MTFDSPISFAEAVRHLASKGLMPTALDSAGIRALDAGLRRQALFSAQTLSTTIGAASLLTISVDCEPLPTCGAASGLVVLTIAAAPPRPTFVGAESEVLPPGKGLILLTAILAAACVSLAISPNCPTVFPVPRPTFWGTMPGNSRLTS